MKVKTIYYFTKEATTGLFRNGLMSLTSIFTITLALIVLGCFYIVATNTNHFANMAKSVLEIRVYLKDKANSTNIQNKILSFDGVKDVKFVSKTEGAKWLEKTLGINGLKNYLAEENPLPDMVNVKLNDDANVKKIAELITSINGVEDVEYGKTFVESMLIIIQVVWIVGIGLIVIIGMVVLYIIVNTIRLTVFARRKEIEIMKLVGATDWFIRWPFILEGVILGVGGALITIIIISKGYHLLFHYIKQLAPFIPLLNEKTINGGLFWMISLVGMAFGAIGSLFSIKRFLKV